MSTIRKIGQGFIVIFGMILLARFLLSTIEPYIPTIICFLILFLVGTHYFHKRRRW